MKPDICLWIDDLDSSFKVFHELMAYKIREILLVLSPYDAFIMEEDTSLSTRIINEYRGLNLSQPPRLTSVSIAEEALEYLDAPIRRIASKNTPVPFSPVLPQP